MELDTSPRAPTITVQLVHIEGPRKGEIDEFQQERITIGRDPASDVALPAGDRAVSRHHAEIKREGNRFLLVNLGRNGTLVNGTYVDQAYLKQGDVITLTEGGAKLSFLSAVKAPPRPRQPVQPALQPSQPPAAASRPPAAASRRPEAGNFTLQYGIQIKSLKKPSLRLGREEDNDFVLKHPSVFKQHAELYYQGEQYFLRDLTESGATLLNDRPVRTDTALHESDTITFGENGPRLRYLGTGRFAEVIEANQEPEPEPETELQEPVATHSAFDLDEGKSHRHGFFKSLFKR